MKRIPVIMIMISIHFFISCAYYNIFYNARQNYRKAYRETLKNRTDVITANEKDLYEKAIVGASKLLQFYPKSKWIDDALFLLGKSFYYQKDYNSARRKFLEMKSNFPESDFSAEVDLWLAKTDLAMKQYTDAETQLTNFVDRKISKKLKGEGYYYLGQVYTARKIYGDAILAYQKAVESGVGILEAEVLYSISVNYDSLAEYSKAAESYQRVLAFDPSEELRFEAEFKYAQMKKKQALFDDAIKLFEKYLGNEQNVKMFPVIKLEIADCLVQKNDFNSAITLYQDITEEHKNTEYSAKAFYELGNLFEMYQDYDAAQESFNEVKKTYSRSEFADSAQVKRRDILRLQALLKIIELADKGNSIEEVIVVTTDSDSLNLPDQNIEDTQTEQDTTNNVTSDISQNEIPPANQQDPDQIFADPSETKAKALPGQADKDQTKQIENPELKTFRVEELDKNIFLLAELYLFRFSLPDSAICQYRRLVDEFPESEYTPHALFNLIYLYENVFSNSLEAQNGYNRLVRDYPNSRFTNAARKSLGLPIVQTKEDSVRLLFNEAENILYRQKNPIAAYHYLASILDRYPDSEIAPKSQYTMAWIAENNLDSLNLAFVLYDSLINRYPETEYSHRIKKKVDYVRNAKMKKVNTIHPDSAATVTILPDTTRQSEDEFHRKREENIPAAPDSITDKTLRAIDGKDRQAVPIGGLNAIVDRLQFPEEIEKKLLTGVVSVKVSVDAEGKVIEVELLRRQKNDEINSAVLSVIRETKFLPARINGKTMPSNVELTIPISKDKIKEFFE